jgi:hypothetical protein
MTIQRTIRRDIEALSNGGVPLLDDDKVKRDDESGKLRARNRS